MEGLERRVIELENRLEELAGILSDRAVYRDPEQARTLRKEETEKKEALGQVTRDWEVAVEAYTKTVEDAG